MPSDPQPATDLSFWREAEPAALLARLGDPALTPTLDDLAALRDRGAMHLMTDPGFADELSLALQRLARRHVARLGEAARAHAWRCRAEACLFTGKLRQARGAYERACAAATTRPALLGQILVGRIHLLSLLGETQRAEALGREAEALLEDADDLPYLAKLQMNRGNALYQQDRYGAALAAYESAAAIFERLGQRDATWVGLLMNQAVALTNLSRVEAARALFLSVERECEQLAQDSLLAHARFNRAFLEALRGDFRSALALLEETGALFIAQEQRDMQAATLRSRAEIYLELGLAGEAEELAREAAAAFRAEGMPLDAALADMGRARALLELGRLDEAADPLATAREYFRERRLRPRIAQAQLLAGRLAFASGDAGAAGTLAGRALRSYAALGLVLGARESRFSLAESRLARREFAAAARSLAAVAAESRQLSSGERLRLHALAGRVARGRGDAPAAARQFERALAALEAQRDLIPGPELRTRAFDRHGGLYGERVALMLESGRPRFDAVFPLVERARARGFRERSDARGEAALAGERAELASLTRRLEDAELQANRPADLDGLRRETLALERRILSEQRRREGLRAGGAQWRDAAAGEIAARLAPDERLLQYFVAEDAVLALVLGRDTRQLRVLPASAGALRASCERLSFQLNAAALAAGRPEPDLAFLAAPMQQVLAELHAALVAPVAACLPAAGRLTLVPHDFLHRVPFECLSDGEGHLDERYVIARAPTADHLLVRAAARPRSRGVTLVAGAVRVGPPEVRAELETVTARLAAAGRKATVSVDPTRQELLAALPRCRHLHLSTHGLFRGDNPHFSRLATDDGAIFLGDIENMELPAELVVLSACESGEVLGEMGDELAGVAHGFLAAGARHLVASRWRVHDAATRDFMDAFYRHYLSGRRRDPARALGAAARELREQRPHPFFWGGFSVYGC